VRPLGAYGAHRNSNVEVAEHARVGPELDELIACIRPNASAGTRPTVAD